MCLFNKSNLNKKQHHISHYVYQNLILRTNAQLAISNLKHDFHSKVLRF